MNQRTLNPWSIMMMSLIHQLLDYIVTSPEAKYILTKLLYCDIGSLLNIYLYNIQ